MLSPLSTGDTRAPHPEGQPPLPQGEEPPKGLSDEDWTELMAMAEAQQPPQQQPYGQRQGSSAAQAAPVPGVPCPVADDVCTPVRLPGWRTMRLCRGKLLE